MGTRTETAVPILATGFWPTEQVNVRLAALLVGHVLRRAIFKPLNARIAPAAPGGGMSKRPFSASALAGGAAPRSRPGCKPASIEPLTLIQYEALIGAQLHRRYQRFLGDAQVSRAPRPYDRVPGWFQSGPQPTKCTWEGG